MRRTTELLREPAAGAVHASPTAGPSLARGAAVAGAVALFLAVAGAFGTAQAAFPVRLGYWVLTIGVGAAIGAAVSGFAARRGWLDASPAAVILGLTIAITAPVTVAVWALTDWVFGGVLDPLALPRFIPAVASITLVATALNVLLDRTPATTHAPSAPQAARTKAPRFLERLPPRLRGADLHAVQAEDHYLRLHTSRGSDLILFRLADAMAELEGIEGAQTHRSWWVAREAVQGADRGDGRATLRLAGGVEAPVSRTYAKALREAGWF